MSDQDEGAEPKRKPILTPVFFDYYRAPHEFNQVVTMEDGSVREMAWKRGPDDTHQLVHDHTYTAEEWAALHPDEPESEP